MTSSSSTDSVDSSIPPHKIVPATAKNFVHPHVLWESQNASLAHPLEVLCPIAVKHGFYLAGGIGLGVHLRHRVSEDLDFFVHRAFDPMALADELQQIDPSGAAGLISRNTLYWSVGSRHGIKVSFIAAQGRSSEVSISKAMGQSVPVASLLDIAAMKSVAIIGRRDCRDYIDLASIVKLGGVSLKRILEYNGDKLQGTHYNAATFVRSLNYFEDLGSNDLPTMTVRLTWQDAKEIIQGAIQEMMPSVRPKKPG